MIKQDFSNLTGKVLIASPFSMEGNVFHKSLIYVIKHANEGSIGFIFNHPINNAPANNLFNQTNKELYTGNLSFDIHLGGPNEVERGFFLHTSDYNKNLLFGDTSSDLVVSSNEQIVQDIANGTGPENNLFIIGYTGWQAGEMEFELENNLWIVAESNHDLIFSEATSQKWDNALRMLGISTSEFVRPNFLASC